MALTKLQAESLNLADDFTFTGTVAGAGGTNTPNFLVRRSDNSQTLSDGIWTKVQFNSVTFDSASSWDSGNYRYTPTTSGKYYFYGMTTVTNAVTSGVYYFGAGLYKNGVTVIQAQGDHRNNYAGYTNTKYVSTVVEMNGSTDYVEVFTLIGGNNSMNVQGNAGMTIFGGYKIIE